MTKHWLGRRGVTIVTIGIGLILVGFGVYGLLNRYLVTHETVTSISSEVVTHSVDEPSESRPDEACRDYVVPPQYPRRIEVSAVGLSGCIQRVGIDQHNAIAVPDNIYLAGWYVNSPLPGEPGVSIIDGHVLGRYNDAIFKDLNRLAAGDIVRIQYGDLSWKSFEVLGVDSYVTAEAMPELLRQVEGVERQVNLITCDGIFNRADQSYDQRLIVRTKLVTNS